ncbi:Ig-like domain-containing protein [Tepidibacter sp. Z1-5]|uniref:Ig-like domain-containing protein n=1 Tax=Tepidibacter sp. Z1-5 TaxID=3134138 RepID=UPI0030C467ED
MNRFKKRLSFFLIFILIFSMIPLGNVRAEDNTVTMHINSVTTDKEALTDGKKGVDYTASWININYAGSFTKNKDLSSIDVLVNGVSKADDFKFDFDDKIANNLKISLKDPNPDKTSMHPVELRKHSLYTIYIPQGFYVDGDGKESKAIKFSFVTKGDGSYPNDIIEGISPSNTSENVDYKNGTITFTFIDDIVLNQELLDDEENNKSKYITISTDPITNPVGDNYIKDDIKNFDLDVDGNKLILKAVRKKADNTVSNELIDFAKYTVKLNPNTVHLKNAENISNDSHTFNFYTNDIVEYTYPEKNQEDVEINPLIKLTFKYPIDTLNKNKITLSSDGDEFAVDMQKDVSIAQDGKTLKIDINSEHREGSNPLRKNTVYRLKLEKGAVSLKKGTLPLTGCGDLAGKLYKDINLDFITGSRTITPDPGLSVEGYSSNESKSDDITKPYDSSNSKATRLDKDGSIYIHFNRNIKWDDEILKDSNPKGSELLSYFKLYKKPKASERDYDPTGKLYDSKFIYDSSKNNTGGEKEEIHIESVEILKDSNGKNRNIIKIKPKYELLNFNQYRIELDEPDDKRIIIDDYDKKLRSDIDQDIWTKPSSNIISPKWDIEDIEAEEIKEDKNAPYKSYTLFGVPRYSDTKPIIINVDNEVMVDVYNKGLSNHLDDIKLYEGYTDNDSSIEDKDIKEYYIEYYFENGVKKTKIYLYPEGTLDAGKYYNLSIPKNVFVTRSNTRMSKDLRIQFVVEGDKDDSKGVYKVVGSSGTNQFNLIDFYKKKVNFDIIGYNFDEDISKAKIVFKNTSSGKKITLTSSEAKITFEDVTKVSVEINASIAKDWFYDAGPGKYEFGFDFNDDGEIDDLDGDPGSIEIDIKPKKKPTIIRTYPENGTTGIDENGTEDKYDRSGIYYKKNDDGVKVYYIIIVFEDIDESIYIDDPNKFILYVDGNRENNLLDVSNIPEFDRSSGQTTISIPIKEILSSATTYTLVIDKDAVYNGAEDGGKKLGNEKKEVNFTTNKNPVVSNVVVGSVPENYDDDKPIVLQGSMFYEAGLEVYFRNSSGEEIKAEKEEHDEDNGVLYVYLPDGSDRLDVGLYDIIVKNSDEHHKFEVVHGVFSVVKEGDYIPNEEYRVKGEEKEGEIRENIKVSEDTIILSSKYKKKSYVDINLDELMGEDTLVRKIKYEGSKTEVLATLSTQSKYSDIVIYNLNPDTYDKHEDVIVNIGRVEPFVTKNIKGKLRGANVVSDFIQVTGDNYSFDKVILKIPFKSSGDNINVLRYDEKMRNWYTVPFSVDKVDKNVYIESKNKGIFVVVD